MQAFLKDFYFSKTKKLNTSKTKKKVKSDKGLRTSLIVLILTTYYKHIQQKIFKTRTEINFTYI